jgi:DNA polymerase-3 subunit beta
MGRFLDGRVSAVVGTHTHVQTADEQVFPGGTAFLCDAGCSGPQEGILGREIEPILRRFTTYRPQRFGVASKRVTLNGALMILKPGSITLVSTDGHRLVFVSRKLEVAGLEEEKKVLIPKKALTELSKLTAEGVSSIEFGSSENHLFFRVGERLLVSRLLTGQFPNYDMVIPQENDKQVVLNTREFVDALKRVSVMADEESHAVRLSVTENQLDIHSSGAEVGEAKESLPAIYKGESVGIGFNAQYLLDFLSGLESEEIELDLRDEETQGLLKPRPKGDYLHQYVIMPMKL